MGERREEWEELPRGAKAEVARDARRRQRRRQAVCRRRCNITAWWHCWEEVVITPVCSGRAGVRSSSVTEVGLRRERVTEQEPSPDLPLSAADSQRCPSFLQVV